MRRFDLGLSLDSAEVRGADFVPFDHSLRNSRFFLPRAGVLMTDDGVECGRASELTSRVVLAPLLIRFAAFDFLGTY